MSTVELGERIFPRCSAILNKIMDIDDDYEIAQLGIGTLGNPAPAQFATDNDAVHEEMPEVEQEDEEEDIDQGEPQPSSPEVAGPSQELDDSVPPESSTHEFIPLSFAWNVSKQGRDVSITIDDEILEEQEQLWEQK
ncbi:NPR1/NIM1-like [Forsythia ovata]|uniref:NPR1/NIM1-like n=1 Tax=Forsythia ovata TaxID=205694 RepID=A0ABD1SKM4_9LAMI